MQGLYAFNLLRKACLKWMQEQTATEWSHRNEVVHFSTDARALSFIGLFHNICFLSKHQIGFLRKHKLKIKSILWSTPRAEVFWESLFEVFPENLSEVFWENWSYLTALRIVGNWNGPLARSICWTLQSGWSVCHTGNWEKLSNSQVCYLAQLCLGAA